MKNKQSCRDFRCGGTSLVLRALWCGVLAQGVMLQLPVQAAQRTWSGGGGDNNWNTAANWGGTLPTVGDSLIFAGTTRTTNYNNLTTLNLTGISFQNSGFLSGGLAITNSGGIYDNAGNNTNNLPTYLSGSQGITNAVTGTVLQLGGIQTNLATGNVLTFGGAGNIYVNGVMSGLATVNVDGDGAGNGLVRLAAANTFAGPLTVNGGTLQLGNASGIPSGNGKGDLTNNATLDLNGFSPTLNGLFGAGTVDNKAGTSTYTLTVGNSTTNLYAGGSWFEYDGVIQNSSGSVALTKVNTNVFYLNGGSDTYGGNTTVSAGKLILGASATLPNTPTITVSPGAQLDVSQQTALSIGASQTLIAGRATNNAGDILGSVDNGGKMVILAPAAAGTLVITNNFTLENGSTITFDLAATNTPGAGSNDLVSLNGTLTLNGGTILLNPYQGMLATGTYGVYTLITNAQTAFSGSAASLTVAVPRGITPTLDDTTFPGNLLVHVAGSGVPVTLTWAGTSSLNTWDVQSSQDWLNGAAADYFYYLDNVTFNDSGYGAVSLATGVSPSSTTFNNSATNYVLSGSGSISGSGALNLNGGGNVTLNTLNNYTGNTYVNYGQLWLGTYNTGSFVNNVVLYNGVTPATLVLGNGGVYLVDQANTFLTATFGLTINSGGSSLAMRGRQSNSTTYSYQITGNPTRNVGGTLDVNNLQTRSGSTVGVYIPATAAVNGILGGYATVNLNDWLVPTNAGTGSGAYAGYQTSTTPTAWGSVSNVALTASPAANLANTVVNSLKLTGPSAVVINAGQTLTLSSGGLLVPNNAAGASSISGGSVLGSASGDLAVLENSSAYALTIASTIADNGGASALTKAGMGTLILSGANTYSGVTYINGATVAGNSTATPGINAAGTLQVGAGGTTGDLGQSPAVTNYGTLAFNRSDNVTLGIPVAGPGGLKKLGAGLLTLTGANTYSGVTVVSGGTLQVGAGASAGSLGSTSSITNNATLVFNRSAATTLNVPVNGSGTLIQMGPGTLTLNSSNAYSGPTIVSNGTVALGSAASIPASTAIVLAGSGSTLDVSAIGGGITLNGGAAAQVLAGIGAVNGSVTAGTGSTITPATNGVAGTLTINNNLTLAGGALKLDVGSASKDLLVVGGALALNSGSVVLNPLNPLANGTYKLISYGSSSGSLANLSFSGFSQAGQLAYLTNRTAANEIDLVVYNGAGASLTWVGDGGNNYWDVGVSANWNNGAGASDFNNNDNVTFNDSSANTTVNLNAGDSPGSVTIKTLANNYTFAGAGSLIGGGAVTINATNTTVTIATTFNNSGPVTINTGTVQVGNGSTQGLLGSGLLTNNGILNFNEPSDTTINVSLAGAGALFQQASGILYLEGNNNAYTGPITISSGVLNVGGGTGSGSLGSGLVTNNGALYVERLGNLTLGNSITGSGPVIFNGSGTVTYGGNNSYANNTYLSNGVVKLASSTALPADGGSGDWLILDGGTAAGTLDLNGHDVAVNALSGSAGTANGLIENNSGTVTNTLSIIGGATTTYSGAIQDNTGSGGKVALFIGGAANQTFDVESSAGNNYSGGTTISNATVTLRSPYSGSTATYGSPVGLGTGPITLISNATLYAVGSGTQNAGPTWSSLANPINIPSGQTATIYGPQRGTMLGSITGAGTLKYVTGYVRGTINGNWSGFAGQIIFENGANGGQLGIANTAGFGRVFCTNAAAATQSVTLYNTVAGTPTIPIGELADDGTAYIESTSSGNAGGAAANFAVGGLNTSATFGGGIIDNVGIIKVGSGSWTLTSAALTYSGLTTVSNGLLVLGASSTLPNTTPITLVSPGILDVSAAGSLTLGAQTLQGNGTLNGSLVANSGSTVSPGGANAIATLTVTNEVALNGTILMELNRTNAPGSNDMLSAASVVAGGTLQVNNIGPDLHTGDTFKLFSVPVTGSFAVTNLPVTTGNGSITYVWTNRLADDGTLSVLVGVPNVNTNPTNLTAVINNNTLYLSWPSDHVGWRLEVQTNGLAVGLSTNTNDWTTVTGSASVSGTNITIDPSKPAAFYRLVYP